jgi:hypothetical protein
VLRALRGRAVRHRFDAEPRWRRPARELTTGYEARW